MALVTYEQALAHLGRVGVPGPSNAPNHDEDLAMKIEQASALVLAHLKRNDWTAASDPDTDPEFAIVQAAILRVLGNLYRFRGDDESSSPNPLDASVVSMLSMHRDPALA